MKNPLDAPLAIAYSTPMNATSSPNQTSKTPCACCGLLVSLDGTGGGFQTDVPALTFCDSACAREWEKRKQKRLYRVVLMAACI